MTPKPKVMLVISTIGGAGAELVVANLCRHIDRELFNVSVCHLKTCGEKGNELIREGYDIVGLPSNGKIHATYLAAFELRKLVLKKRIDLLHSHNVEPLFECALCKLVTPHLKLIHTYHFGNYPHLPLHYLLLEGIYSRVADKLIAVGVNQRRQIAATYRLKLQHIETVHNGIIAQPVTEEKLIMRTQVTKGIVVIGSICTFIYQKGLDYLLSVAKIMMQEESNVIFWVVGDGPLREEIEKKKEAMGLGDIVKLHGWIPNAAQNILPQFDIFLQTSRWEAMSMVILEAMVAGKPIVATDVGENRQIVLSAGAGYIVQPGEIRSTVHHLKLLAAQPDLRKTMGERGIAAVKSNYGVATMTRQYETIYAKVLKLSE